LRAKVIVSFWAGIKSSLLRLAASNKRGVTEQESKMNESPDKSPSPDSAGCSEV